MPTLTFQIRTDWLTFFYKQTNTHTHTDSAAVEAHSIKHMGAPGFDIAWQLYLPLKDECDLNR